jgi:hypothetical protein
MTRHSKKKKNSGVNLAPVPWSDYPGYVIKEKKFAFCFIGNVSFKIK